MTRHVFSVEPVGMNLALYNELSEEQKNELQKAFDDSSIYQRQVAQETEEQQLEKCFLKERILWFLILTI